VQAGISIGIVISAPADQQAAVATAEANGILGGVGGAGLGEALCIALGIATEGFGLVACGLVAGIAGSEASRRGNLLQVLDIAPHDSSAQAGRFYIVEGCWDETDLFITSICNREVKASDHILVLATGRVSGELVSGKGHYRRYQVEPVSNAATALFGGNAPQWVNQYLLVPATAADLAGAD
jgi:hypothetical protein